MQDSRRRRKTRGIEDLGDLCEGKLGTLSHCTCNLTINPSISLQQGAVPCVRNCDPKEFVPGGPIKPSVRETVTPA